MGKVQVLSQNIRNHEPAQTYVARLPKNMAHHDLRVDIGLFFQMSRQRPKRYALVRACCQSPVNQLDQDFSTDPTSVVCTIVSAIVRSLWSASNPRASGGRPHARPCDAHDADDANHAISTSKAIDFLFHFRVQAKRFAVS